MRAAFDNYLRCLCATAFTLGALWLMLQAQAHQRAWEAANHCQVIGHTANPTFVLDTTTRRTLLGCDCGYSWRYGE